MQVSKFIKRFFIVIAVIIGLVLGAAIIIPVFFKDKIMAVLKKELNNNLNAVTDFKDVNISLFHHFPNLSVGIESLSVSGVDAFKGDTLITTQNIEVTVDIVKAIKGTYDILNIAVNTPVIHAIVHEDGQANWNITKPDTSAKTGNTPASPLALKLRKYSITHANIYYRDDQGKMYLNITDLTHSGTGDFTSDLFTLTTNTTADAITFTFGNITYLSQVKLSADLALEVDNKANKYSFNTEKVNLNGLRLATKGYVQLPDTTNTVMDVSFSTPGNDFKDILSLVPGIYLNNFKDIKTTGTATLNGFVKGTYNTRQLPAYEVNLLVSNGSFQYPSLPEKVSDIQIKMKAVNADGITDHTVVNLEKGHIVFGSEPFDFHLLLKTPISNPWVDAGAKGRIDLGKFEKFMKLEQGTKLVGIINADVTAKGPIAAATGKQLDKFYAAGTIGISSLVYASKDYPDGVNIDNLLMKFNPANVSVSGLKGSYLKTNFNGDGTINNLLGFYLHNDVLSGSFNVAADKIDVNKWMGTTAATANTNTPAAPATPAATGAFAVPANLDLTLNAQAGTVVYDNLTLTAVSGRLQVKDQTVYLQDVSGKGLDGTIKINGYYSTKKDKKNPDIHLAYNVAGLDIQKTFLAFNTVQKLMPIGKYLSGKLTSQLTLDGKLGQDMMPVMNTLTGKGDMLLLEGLLKNFTPVNQLADKLSIQSLKDIAVKDVKTAFSFENGRVTVKPFQFKVNDIAMEVAGSHGFDQTLQYGINMVVPRSLLGSQGNALVENLVSKANTKGVPVQVGDKVNLAVTIGGTIANPVIKTDLKSVAGNAVDNVKKQLEAEANRRIDSAKAVVKDTIKQIKKQLVNDATNAIKDKLLNNGSDTGKKSDPINDTKEKAKESVKGALKNIFNKNK